MANIELDFCDITVSIHKSYNLTATKLFPGTYKLTGDHTDIINYLKDEYCAGDEIDLEFQVSTITQ